MPTPCNLRILSMKRMFGLIPTWSPACSTTIKLSIRVVSVYGAMRLETRVAESGPRVLPVTMAEHGFHLPASEKMPSHEQPMNVLINRLKMIADLTAEVGSALRTVVANEKSFAANQEIVSQGDSPSQCCVVLEGWVSRNKIIEGGRRQITAIHFAGFIPDLQGMFTPVMDHNISTLTAVQAAFIPHSKLRELMNRFPELAQVLLQETVLEAAIAREWEVNLGARPAPQRIAHVFCEIGTRLQRFGYAERDGRSLSFEWPMSQTQLGDATGLSAVHVNRSLQVLRGSALIEVSRDRVNIHDMPRLEEFAGFNPDYLLAERPRANG